MKITLDNYQETMKSFCSTLPTAQHNAHMAMGVTCELGELSVNFAEANPYDRINVIEESGDASWFLSQYCEENNMNFKILVNHTFSMTPEDATKFFEALKPAFPGSTILDLSKDEMAYGKDVTMKQREDAVIEAIWFLRETVHSDATLNYEDILQKNYDKLSSRYPNKVFSSDSALNRDLEVERSVLEQEKID